MLWYSENEENTYFLSWTCVSFAKMTCIEVCGKDWLVDSQKCLYTTFLWNKCILELLNITVIACLPLQNLLLKDLVCWYLEDYCLNHLGEEEGKILSSQSSECFCISFSMSLSTVLRCLSAIQFSSEFAFLFFSVLFLKMSSLGLVCSKTVFRLHNKLHRVREVW